jgi:hypothetical protein
VMRCVHPHWLSAVNLWFDRMCARGVVLQAPASSWVSHRKTAPRGSTLSTGRRLPWPPRSSPKNGGVTIASCEYSDFHFCECVYWGLTCVPSCREVIAIIVFTFEYIGRLFVCTARPLKEHGFWSYVLSPANLVDVSSIPRICKAIPVLKFTI